MVLPKLANLAEVTEPLQLVDWPKPEPAPHELLIRVTACGVCHTELDEIEGRTPPAMFPIIPGHQVVGRVEQLGEQLGAEVTTFQLGDRVGAGWIYCSSGAADENLSEQFRATGRDAHGGYAEYFTIPAAYAYPIPEFFTDAGAAPLLCAGAIGFRALRLTGLCDGQLLGLTGFGGSAHLVLQMVRQQYPRSEVFVFARDPAERQLASELGAVWTGHSSQRSPVPLHAIIDTTPAWQPVVDALANLRPGGRLVINAIRKEENDKSYLLNLNYHEHLWLERELKSVANITADDIRQFLPLAAELQLQPVITTYPLEQANRALFELKRGRTRGAKVLLMNE